jgi:hypothetical protein
MVIFDIYLEAWILALSSVTPEDLEQGIQWGWISSFAWTLCLCIHGLIFCAQKCQILCSLLNSHIWWWVWYFLDHFIDLYIVGIILNPLRESTNEREEDDSVNRVPLIDPQDLFAVWITMLAGSLVVARICECCYKQPGFTSCPTYERLSDVNLSE